MPKPYHLTTINNLKIILYPIKELPAVKANLVIRAGSSYETGNNWGAFHFIEHLSFHQTKLFKNKLELELYKEEYGLNNNAGTGREDISYFTYGPSSSLEQALILLHEIAFETTLPQEAFPKEISIITQEYNDKWDSPHERYHLAGYKQIYGENHPYIRDGLGQPEYIKTLSRSDLQKLHHQYFTNQNSTLSLTGDFDTKHAKNLIKKIFINTRKGDHTPPNVTIKPGKHHLIHKDDIQQDTPILTWLTPGFLDLPLEERFALWIARYILGGSTRSLIFQRLREDLNLTYRCGANRKFNPHAGYFELWASNSPEHTQKIINEMRQVIYHFIETKIDPQTYQRSLNYLKSNISLSFDSIDHISDAITYNFFWENKIYLPDEDIKLLLTIKENFVRKTLAKYVTPKNEYLSLMTPKPTSKTARESS